MTFLDYAGIVDVIAALILLVIWIKKPRKKLERTLTFISILVSLAAGVLWVADSKCSHRLSVLQNQPKPLDERLRTFLDNINPVIMEELRKGTRLFEVEFNGAQMADFNRLRSEPGVEKYLISVQMKFSGQLYSGDSRNSLAFELSTNLIKSP